MSLIFFWVNNVLTKFKIVSTVDNDGGEVWMGGTDTQGGFSMLESLLF